MTDKKSFLEVAESEIRLSRAMRVGTFAAWTSLADEAKATLLPLIRFLGYPVPESSESVKQPSTEADRFTTARLMLLNLGVDTSDPRWSSEVLDQLLIAQLELSNGSLDELFQAVGELLRESSPELSPPLFWFIRDLVIRSFTAYRLAYDKVQWNRIATGLGDHPNQAQLFFAFHAIPEEFLSPELVETINRSEEAGCFEIAPTHSIAV